MHYILAKVLWLYNVKSKLYVDIKHFSIYVYFLGPTHAMAIYMDMFHKYPTR